MFLRELDISSEFFQAHHQFQAILTKSGYPPAARKECDDLLVRLRKQADNAFVRAFEHRPPPKGLVHPLSITEWRDEVSERVNNSVRALKELSRARLD